MVDNDEGSLPNRIRREVNARGSSEHRRLIERFLSWPLPRSVRSDVCVTMDYPHPRTGTNLLTADEARQMFEYLFAPAAVGDETERPGEAAVTNLIKEAVRSASPRKTAAIDILDRMRERQADLTGCVFDADAKIFGDGADEIERLRALVPEKESSADTRDGAVAKRSVARSEHPSSERRRGLEEAALKLSEACDAMWNDPARWDDPSRHERHMKAITAAQRNLRSALIEEKTMLIRLTPIGAR